ncbi:MAG TPA: YceI family protein [Verrucomicrobiae bacterium]|nr:YceI family protein [Verrucomicrobiae bacterium]
MINPIRILVALGAFARLLAAGDSIPSGQCAYRIDPAHTRVEFTVDSTLHTIHGTFVLKRGDLRFDPATGKASGELLVDAASGESGSNARDNRMNSHILESQRYSEIAFRPERVEGAIAPSGKSQLQLHGKLIIHGGEHEMTLPLAVDAEGGQYSVAASFEVPYVKWGMKNPSTLILRVSERVEITVHTVAHLTN